MREEEDPRAPCHPAADDGDVAVLVERLTSSSSASSFEVVQSCDEEPKPSPYTPSSSRHCATRRWALPAQGGGGRGGGGEGGQQAGKGVRVRGCGGGGGYAGVVRRWWWREEERSEEREEGSEEE